MCNQDAGALLGACAGRVHHEVIDNTFVNLLRLEPGHANDPVGTLPFSRGRDFWIAKHANPEHREVG